MSFLWIFPHAWREFANPIQFKNQEAKLWCHKKNPKQMGKETPMGWVVYQGRLEVKHCQV